MLRFKIQEIDFANSAEDKTVKRHYISKRIIIVIVVFLFSDVSIGRSKVTTSVPGYPS